MTAILLHIFCCYWGRLRPHCIFSTQKRLFVHLFQGNDGELWANNTVTGAPYRTYCLLCSAGNACNATGLTEPDLKCAEGHFCKLGAYGPMPYCEAGEGLCTYGVCPAGHYCELGTSDPVVCPPGVLLALSTATSFILNKRTEVLRALETSKSKN